MFDGKTEIGKEAAGPITKMVINIGEKQDLFDLKDPRRVLTLGINLSRNKDHPINYYKVNDLARTARLSLIFRTTGLDRPVQLSDKELSNLGMYLAQEEELDPREDCASFVHRIKGVPFTPGNTETKAWDFEQITNDEQLQPGDAIFLGNSDDHGRLSSPHFAIYLGEGIYLSKAGNKNKLVATDLPNMMAFWPTQFILKMRPADPPHRDNYMPAFVKNLPTNFRKIL